MIIVVVVIIIIVVVIIVIVVVIIVIYIIMVTMFQTPNGSTPSYFNWKDNSALGNCAYLFTKVII